MPAEAILETLRFGKGVGGRPRSLLAWSANPRASLESHAEIDPLGPRNSSGRGPHRPSQYRSNAGSSLAQRLIVAALFLIPTTYLASREAWKWMSEHSLPKVIDIGAGMQGGMYERVANQLANRLEISTGKHPLVVSTEGSDDNLGRLLSGQVDLGILQTNSVKGERVAVVAPLYHEAFHLLIRKDLPDPTFESIRGMRIAMGLAHSGTRQATRSILRHFEMTEEDFQ